MHGVTVLNTQIVTVQSCMVLLVRTHKVDQVYHNQSPKQPPMAAMAPLVSSPLLRVEPCQLKRPPRTQVRPILFLTCIVVTAAYYFARGRSPNSHAWCYWPEYTNGPSTVMYDVTGQNTQIVTVQSCMMLLVRTHK